MTQDDIEATVDELCDSIESEAERLGISAVELASRVLTETRAREE